MRTLVHISDTHVLPTADDRLHGADTLRNLQGVLKLVAADGVRPDARPTFRQALLDAEPSQDPVGRRGGVPLLRAGVPRERIETLRTALLD